MVENLFAKAGDEVSIPDQGTKITSGPGHLDPETTAAEPLCSGTHLGMHHSLRDACKLQQ